MGNVMRGERNQRDRPLGGTAEQTSDQLAFPLGEPLQHPVMSELASLDIDGMTPVAALNKLVELRDRASV